MNKFQWQKSPFVVFNPLLSDFYDSATHKKLTEENLHNLPEGEIKKLYIFIYPGENGEKISVLNSAKIFINFKKVACKLLKN